MHAATDLNYVAAIGGSLYEDYRESELEPGYEIGWEEKNLMLGGGLEIIMEGVSDVRNANGEVISVKNGDNQTECRCY